MAKENENTASSGGQTCGAILLLLIIAGACMWKICEEAGQVEYTDPLTNETIINQDCGGNEKISRAGFLMLVIAGGIGLATCGIVCCALCCAGIMAVAED